MRDQPTRTRHLPIIGAGVLLAFVLGIGVLGAAASNDASGASTAGAPPPSLRPSAPSSTAMTTIPDSAAPPTTPVEPTPTPAPAPASPLPDFTETLGLGSSGPAVERLQQRLGELGFVPGGDDGYFGELTEQAVWAYEKLVIGTPRDDVTGLFTADMWEHLLDPDTAVEPRRAAPGTDRHTEILLPEQVIAVFHGQRPVFVAHMSHGTGDEWCNEVTISPGEYGNEDGTEPLYEGRCGVSSTPGGVFEYDRMVEGHRDSALGGMLNPVYFNYGIAVHGAYNVPNDPASHGCVRIPNEISSIYQSLVDIGERVYVWDGVHEPEHYGDQPPTFDWVWDEYESRPPTAEDFQNPDS